MKAEKVHIESTQDQKQADDLHEKTLKTLHPDVRLAEEEKLKHRKKLRNLGAKIYFKDDVNNTKNSMMKGSVNSGALNNACDFEMVSMEERLQLPLRSHGLIDVQFCKNEEYRSRLVVLGKNGVVRVVELPIS